MTALATAGLHQTTNLWQPNPNGARDLCSALQIAEQNGVDIPEEAYFRVLGDGAYDLHHGTGSYACYGQAAYENPRMRVHWQRRTGSPCLLDEDGRIIIFVRESVLLSDLAITAVFGHECFEIEYLKREFGANSWGMSIENYIKLISPGIPGNIHWQAVDYGDDLVRKMVDLKS